MKRVANSIFSGGITLTYQHQSCLLHAQVATVRPPLLPPDIYAANQLINKYTKSGQLDIAHQLFAQMPHKNIVSWTALISGYAHQWKPDHCFHLFAQMLSHYRPNDFAYASLLSACDHSRGVQVHAHALKTGFDAWVYVANALIAMYWKNCRNGGKGIEAWNVFNDALNFRNLVTYNSMINGLGMYAQVYKAMALFTSMCRNQVGFDRTTILSLLSSLSECKDDVQNDVVLTCCLQLHCASIKTSLAEDIGIVTALIKAYSNLGVHASDFYKLFLETKCLHQDVVLWTTTMGAFSEREPEQVLSLFNQMRTASLYPDYYVFSVLLKACASLVTERHALAVHSQVIVVGFVNVLVIENALIHAYAKCGSLDKAKQVFDEMEAARDIITWNSMLKAYAMHGKAEMVFNLFEKMEVEPDGTTFVALLSACSHAGLVKEGTKIFDTMFEKYGIIPQLDHYACIVDILGRAGHLFDAARIITKMPLQTDYVVWSALLGACRKHGNVRLANLASSKLKELNPGNSLGYVMTSNIYCSAENFYEGGVVWKDMRKCGVKKVPGLSWTEIGHSVHEFASGGKRHPEIGSIRANLEVMLGKLKKIGYVPETSLVLYDIEEEHKEEQLYLHSEKLALVFSLMNASRTSRNEGVIKIIKNIRICLDCHNFMRLASKLVEKDIVVRDANRFHNFKEGACSCNDYW